MKWFVVVAVVGFVVSSVRLVMCLGIAGVQVRAAGGWMEGGRRWWLLAVLAVFFFVLF